MASKKIHFRPETPLPSHGHQKGQNAAGFHPPVGGVKLETAPGRLGKHGYVRIAKG